MSYGVLICPNGPHIPDSLGRSSMVGEKGKPGGAPHKTYLTRVLLHDNVSQKQLLETRLSSIATQQRRSGRMWENHKKAFVNKQYRKHHKFRGLAVDADAVSLVSSTLQRASLGLLFFQGGGGGWGGVGVFMGVGR